MYTSNREEPMLILLLNSYSKLKVILVSTSRSFSYFILYYLLTVRVANLEY